MCFFSFAVGCVGVVAVVDVGVAASVAVAVAYVDVVEVCVVVDVVAQDGVVAYVVSAVEVSLLLWCCDVAVAW